MEGKGGGGDDGTSSPIKHTMDLPDDCCDNNDYISPIFATEATRFAVITGIRVIGCIGTSLTLIQRRNNVIYRLTNT